MDVEGVVRKVEQKIESCTQQDVELHIERVSRRPPLLISPPCHARCLATTAHYRKEWGAVD